MASLLPYLDTFRLTLSFLRDKRVVESDKPWEARRRETDALFSYLPAAKYIHMQFYHSLCRKSLQIGYMSYPAWLINPRAPEGVLIVTGAVGQLPSRSNRFLDLRSFQAHLHMSQSELRRIFQVEHHNDGELVELRVRLERVEEVAARAWGMGPNQPTLTVRAVLTAFCLQ